MTLHSINAKTTPQVSFEAEIHTLRLMIEKLRKQLELRDARHAQAVEQLTWRLDTEMPIRERLASLEARIASNPSSPK